MGEITDGARLLLPLEIVTDGRTYERRLLELGGDQVGALDHLGVERFIQARQLGLQILLVGYLLGLPNLLG